jgi:hypothetical protein
LRLLIEYAPLAGAPVEASWRGKDPATRAITALRPPDISCHFACAPGRESRAIDERPVRAME